MCFKAEISNTEKIRQAAQALTRRQFELPIDPPGVISAFAHPELPAVLSTQSLELLKWGLIPPWVTDAVKARDIRKKTLNARCETLFRLPSFRSAAKTRHCVILVNAFFEYHHEEDGKTKTEYRISYELEETMLLAGLWEPWQQRQTCTVITMPANTLLAEIHNSKRRMPVLLSEEQARQWLVMNSPEQAAALFEPNDTLPLKAESVKKADKNSGKKQLH